VLVVVLSVVLSVVAPVGHRGHGTGGTVVGAGCPGDRP